MSISVSLPLLMLKDRLIQHMSDTIPAYHWLSTLRHGVAALCFPFLPFPCLPFPSPPLPSPPLPSLSLPFPSLPFPSLPFPSLPFPSLPFPINKSLHAGLVTVGSVHCGVQR